MNMEHLLTTRLNLRPLQIHDVDIIFSLRSDHRNNQYLDRPPCQTKEEAAAFITSILTKTENSPLKYWVISLKDSDILIGTICLYNQDENSQSAEIGFELLPNFQGQGYMNESINTVIEYAKNALYLKYINACTHQLNTKSISVLNQCGFLEIDPESNNEKELLLFKLNLAH
jgi:ribosomal-protein-alanine N-acetyltransferase